MPGGTLTREEFAASIKAKYPAYASVPDAELVDKMLAKYPVYQDQIVDFKSTAEPAPLLNRAASVVGDLGMGALKGLGQTATNLGEAVHLIPGVSRAVDALYGAPVSQPSFEAADQALQPSNTAQAIGKGAEQIAEFFIPGRAVSRAVQGLGMGGRAALEAGVGGGVAAAQGGSLPEVAASGALSALPGAIELPAKRLRASIAEHLHAKAAKRVTEGLGATTKRLKNEAQRIAPEFAERGLTGSVESIAETATTQVDDLGKQIGATIKGPVGQETRATAPIVAGLEKAKSKLTTQAVGTGERIVTDKPQHEALSKLQEVVQEYGDEMSVAQINALKKIYARVTSRSGGYNEKAGEILHTAPEAAKSFAAILRKEENGVDALKKLNKEFRFWKGVQNVTKATVDRRSSQGKGLTAAVAPVIGAATGFSSGGDVTDRAASAIAGGIAGRKLTTALQSPQWKFVRAKYAEKLAQAIASHDSDRVGQVVGKILAAEAAHVN